MFVLEDHCVNPDTEKQLSVGLYDIQSVWDLSGSHSTIPSPDTHTHCLNQSPID